jgi:hypothetical protein
MFSEENGHRKPAAKIQYSCTDEIHCSIKNKMTFFQKMLLIAGQKVVDI